MNPPSPPNANNRREESVCGKKFRSMLKCVEKTGAISSCHPHIHDFLDCQRAIMNPSNQPDHNNHSNLNRVRQTSSSSLVSHSHPAQFLERIVRRQASACNHLWTSLSDIEPHTKIPTFTKRMFLDIQRSCCIVRDHVRKSFTSLWRNSYNRDKEGAPKD